MRRRFISLLLAGGLVLAMAPQGAAADQGDRSDSADRGAPAARPLVAPQSAADGEDEQSTPAQAQDALDTAADVLAGEGDPGDPSPTLALTELAQSADALSGADRRRARALLARPDDPAASPKSGSRPTDGFNDPYGDGYTRPSFKRCSRHFCLHFTKRGGDQRPSGKWVARNLKVLEAVWRHHIGRLGYRRPVSDGRRGGNGKFDVYLKNIGFQGYYGYCAPERRPNPGRRLESGFCVLDNDFSRAEFFGAPPVESLKVTAAHEFFHAIQYNYDVREDRWLMEATATWIEERFADGINDNRQFLRAGQLANPARPLDLFSFGSRAPYGNWAFFEFLSSRFGPGIVRRIWNRAGDFAGAPDQHSVQAVRTALQARKRWLPGIYARFAAANTIPEDSYPEGKSWPRAPISAAFDLTPSQRGTGKVTRRLNHLTSRNIDVTRTRTAFDGRWRLLVKVNGPPRASGPGAHAIVHLRGGRKVRRLLPLNRWGNTTQRLRFDSGVEKVTLTIANASTRYRCWQGRSWSCEGVSLDDDREFTVRAYAVRR